VRVQHSRFVFVAVPIADAAGEPAGDAIVWLLVSPNNRPLGRSGTPHRTYDGCHASVLHLRASYLRLTAQSLVTEDTGQWTWRVELDGATVAVSSRTYLRMRECHYSLERFLESVPQAAIVSGARSAHRGRRPAEEALPRAPIQPIRRSSRMPGYRFGPSWLAFDAPVRPVEVRNEGV
jgi:hypothetical protein